MMYLLLWKFNRSGGEQSYICENKIKLQMLVKLGIVELFAYNLKCIPHLWCVLGMDGAFFLTLQFFEENELSETGWRY